MWKAASVVAVLAYTANAMMICTWCVVDEDPSDPYYLKQLNNFLSYQRNRINYRPSAPGRPSWMRGPVPVGSISENSYNVTVERILRVRKQQLTDFKFMIHFLTKDGGHCFASWINGPSFSLGYKQEISYDCGGIVRYPSPLLLRGDTHLALHQTPAVVVPVKSQIPMPAAHPIQGNIVAAVVRPVQEPVVQPTQPTILPEVHPIQNTRTPRVHPSHDKTLPVAHLTQEASLFAQPYQEKITAAAHPVHETKLPAVHPIEEKIPEATQPAQAEILTAIHPTQQNILPAVEPDQQKKLPVAHPSHVKISAESHPVHSLEPEVSHLTHDKVLAAVNPIHQKIQPAIQQDIPPATQEGILPAAHPFHKKAVHHPILDQILIAAYPIQVTIPGGSHSNHGIQQIALPAAQQNILPAVYPVQQKASSPVAHPIHDKILATGHPIQSTVPVASQPTQDKVLTVAHQIHEHVKPISHQKILPADHLVQEKAVPEAQQIHDKILTAAHPIYDQTKTATYPFPITGQITHPKQDATVFHPVFHGLIRPAVLPDKGKTEQTVQILQENIQPTVRLTD